MPLMNKNTTMPTNKSKDTVLLRSQEVQELIGHIPGGFMRYGIGLILVLLIAVLTVCNFIPYSEVKSFPLRILPNVSTEDIRSPVDGSITRCHVKEGMMVSTGDTLLAIHADGELRILRATACGKVRLCSFFVTNETVRKGQTLMEICQQSSRPKPLLAIADTLPRSVALGQLQTIEVDIYGRRIPFKMIQTIEDEESGKTQALFRSEQCLEATQPHRADGEAITNDGVLLDKLIQLKW